jgi:hypothetical protein
MRLFCGDRDLSRKVRSNKAEEVEPCIPEAVAVVVPILPAAHPEPMPVLQEAGDVRSSRRVVEGAEDDL